MNYSPEISNTSSYTLPTPSINIIQKMSAMTHGLLTSYTKSECYIMDGCMAKGILYGPISIPSRRRSAGMMPCCLMSDDKSSKTHKSHYPIQTHPHLFYPMAIGTTSRHDTSSNPHTMKNTPISHL